MTNNAISIPQGRQKGIRLSPMTPRTTIKKLRKFFLLHTAYGQKRRSYYEQTWWEQKRGIKS